MPHLTPEQLMAYRDGESQDPGVERHLASCESCRRKLADSRLLALLARAAEPGPPPSSHPSPEKLAAYHDQTLSRSQTLNVEKHLRSCEPCLTQLIMLRRDLAVPAEYSPDEALVERVKSRFRPPPRHRLGQVILEELKGMSGIRLLPTYAEAS
ncbi:MAG: zf-HC2 domain-containing protein [Deltaproteobacteria bacterium]|nr:zf-HC2 domain-containing protein [Deltaproteobacteria bacterium]